jgi:TrkA domain protein
LRIRESALPGIGQKFEVMTKDDEKIVIIVHDDGRRDMYHYDFDDLDESISSVTLDDAESRQIAAILGGIVYKPQAIESIELALDDLRIEWVKVKKNSKLAGKTIDESNIRQEFAVNIIAILNKPNKKILNPGPSSIIDAGDTIVLSGERKDVNAFMKQALFTEGESV